MIARRVSRIASTVVVAAAIATLPACSRMTTGPSSLATDTVSGVLAQRVGDGNTPFRLTKAGWHCLNVPGHGVHCEDPQAAIGSSVHIQVKVFDTADPLSDSATFLGTESLVRADHYKGQPCLPGHGEYFLLPFGYYACHHFDF